jgi:hypothetical protein
VTIDLIRPEPSGPRDDAGDSRHKKADRGKWLAELEQKSFQVSDDRIRQPDSLPVAEKPPGSAPLTGSQPPWLEAAGSEPSVAGETAWSRAGLQAYQTSAPRVSGPALDPAPARAGLQQPAAWAPPSINLPLSGSRLTAQTAQAVQRVEVLMSQLRFMELNVRITQQGEEVTLWIRDFKQKYGQQAYHWIKELQTILPRCGQKLTRIVVNGRELVHLGELIGGDKWQ